MFSIASFFGRYFLRISPKNNQFVLISKGYKYQPKVPFRGIQPIYNPLFLGILSSPSKWLKTPVSIKK
jgi:hypothetical protein